ncbi:N-acetyltransferase [Gramella sp. BOM4]|nr:N-acetyltransferase [Christiangramia bathymodioli]
MHIRQETEKDHKTVFEVIKESFQDEKMSNHKEQFLVEKLRKSNAFIPELSLVAEFENKIVGYILLTRVKIKNNHNTFDSLALAPISVLPEFQGRGIGSALINFAQQKARALDFSSVVLLGHENYYPRFGYKRAELFNIEFPFKAPKENCMLVELKKDALKEIKGLVEYPKEFYE